MRSRPPKPAAPKKAASPASSRPSASEPAAAGLLPELRELILTTRRSVAHGVNAALTMLHWQVGDRIRRDVLREARAGYGDEILSTLSRELTSEFGRGFSEKALRHMVRLAESFPDPQIVSTLSRQLAWSHFKEIIYLKDELQRDFYAEMCRLEGWSVRALREKSDCGDGVRAICRSSRRLPAWPRWLIPATEHGGGAGKRAPRP